MDHKAHGQSLMVLTVLTNAENSISFSNHSFDLSNDLSIETWYELILLDLLDFTDYMMTLFNRLMQNIKL